jgi:hypothetical protein
MRKVIGKYWWVFLLAFYLIVWIFQLKLIIDPDLNNFDYLYKISKEIFSGTITIIGISIAYNGLVTWRDQLKGKYDFDLACQAMRDISKIRIAYINFSTMWLFFKIVDKNEKIIIRLQMIDDYFQKLNELRSEIIKFRTIKNEIEAIWDDFPHDAMGKMLIKANSYLADGERFISYCQWESKSLKHISFEITNQEDVMNKLFLKLCSDIVIKYGEIILPFSSDFRENYIEFLYSHEQLRLFLDKKIKQYISKI